MATFPPPKLSLPRSSYCSCSEGNELGHLESITAWKTLVLPLPGVPLTFFGYTRAATASTFFVKECMCLIKNY